MNQSEQVVGKQRNIWRLKKAEISLSESGLQGLSEGKRRCECRDLNPHWADETMRIRWGEGGEDSAGRHWQEGGANESDEEQVDGKPGGKGHAHRNNQEERHE